MARKRIDYPGLEISNGDAEKYFDFYDTRMRPYYLRAIETILSRIGDEGKVLDIGCGAAVFGVLLCDKTEYFNVTGLERSSLLVRIGEAITSRVGYSNRISLKIWNDDELAFPDNEFDAVVGLMSLHRWGKIHRILPEIERVRKTKSVIYISDFRREYMFPPFSVYALSNRMKAGKAIAADLMNSYKSAYTVDEINAMLRDSGITDWNIEKGRRIVTLSSIRGTEMTETSIDHASSR